MLTKKIIYWLPRVLSILFVLFLSLFALDVFEKYSGIELLTALFIHLAPSFVLLAVMAVAWKYELVGVAVFLAGAVGYIFMAGFNRPWTWYAFISGPALIVAILFLVSWLDKKRK